MRSNQDASALATIQAVDPVSAEAPTPSVSQDVPSSPVPVARQDEGSGAELRPKRPANEDGKLAGDILRALHHRPSKWPYLVAALASGIYVAGLLTFGRFDLAQISYDLEGMVIAGLVGTPVIAFMLLAAFARQVMRVRHSADAMARVALQLVSPASAAQDEVFSLSQTVRMEVASLGDGIERGLSRIGEMELLASDLIRRLEEAHSKADLKMHSLTRRLESEREALESYAERIGETVQSARARIDLDLTETAEKIANRVAGASVSIMGEVEERARAAIDAAHHHLELKAHELGGVLEIYAATVTTANDRTKYETEAACDNLVAHNEAYLHSLQEILAAAQQEFSIMQSQSLDVFETESGAIAEALQKSAQSLADKSAEMLARLNEFDTQSVQRLSEAANEISLAGNAVGSALTTFEATVEDMRIGVGENLEALVGGIRTEFERQSTAFDAQVERNANILKTTLDQAMDQVNTVFINGLRDLSAVLAEDKTGEELQAAVAALQKALRAGVEQFHNEYAQLCASVTDLLDRSAAQIGGDILRASESATDRMRDAGAHLSGSLSDTGNVLLRNLDSLQREILSSVQEASVASARFVEEAAKAPLANIRSENERLKEEAKAALKNLSELNAVIRSTIVGAEKRIGAAANTLASQTEAYLSLVEGKRPGPAVASPAPAPAPTSASSLAATLASLQASLPGSKPAPSPAKSLAGGHEPRWQSFQFSSDAPEKTAPALDAPAEYGEDVLSAFASHTVPLPDRGSPKWISSLLARASVEEDSGAVPKSVSDLVHVDRLERALVDFEAGRRSIHPSVYRPTGLSILRHIQSRYASQRDFRVAADQIASSFLNALDARLVAGGRGADWKHFIETNISGLITAHAIGAIQGAE